MKYILARLKEPSTWRGIFMFLTGVGISIEPAMYAQITTIGISIVGLIGILTKDKKDEEN